MRTKNAHLLAILHYYGALCFDVLPEMTCGTMLFLLSGLAYFVLNPASRSHSFPIINTLS